MREFRSLKVKDEKEKMTETDALSQEVTGDRTEGRSTQEQSKAYCGKLMEENRLVTNQKKNDEVWRMNEGLTATKSRAECPRTNEEWQRGKFMAEVVEDTQTDERLKKQIDLEQLGRPGQHEKTWSGVLKESTRSNCSAHNIRPAAHHTGSNRSPAQQIQVAPQAHGYSSSNKTTQPMNSTTPDGANHISSFAYDSTQPSLSIQIIPVANTNSSHKDTQNHRGPGSKRWSTAEFQTKLDRGLGFRCNERYVSNHRFRFRHFRLLLMDDDEEEEKIEMSSELGGVAFPNSGAVEGEVLIFVTIRSARRS